MARIERAFTSVLDRVSTVYGARHLADGRVDYDAAPLLEAQVELLEAMLAHVDDGYQILKACSAPQPEVTEPFADRWLEKVKHPTARGFKNAVASYRSQVAPLGSR